MEFQDLNILVKYCSNQINAHKFVELMLPIYNDENYIMNLWPQFRDNVCMFIVSRNEIELFNNIHFEMNKINYTG